MGHLIKNRKYLTEPEVQYFLLQIIDAIKYLHNRRIIHRDLKLGNIFLDDNLDVKVGDFGLATELNEPNERKKTMCGTPNYIAPEILQSEGKRAYSSEVDIWAIGVITYTLLIGKAPYDGGNRENTYENIRQNDFSFPIKDRFVSHQARMFIRSILTTDPASRLSLDQMLQHPFFTDSPISPPKSLPPYILYQPYLLTSRPATEPTPVLQRTHRSVSSSDSAADPSSSPQARFVPSRAADPSSKRVRMTDLAKPLPLAEGKPHSRVATLHAAGEPGVNYNFDYDGNGKNNINRFSLTAHQARGMDDRLDLANQTFLEAHGLTAKETFEGLPEGTVPSITVKRSRYQDVPGTPMLIGHAANLHTAMHHPLLSGRKGGP